MLETTNNRQNTVNEHSEYKTPLKAKLFKFIQKALFGFIIASFINFIFSYFFHTPKVFSLSKENNELVAKIKLLKEEIEISNDKLNNISTRDKNIYRAVLGVDSIEIPKTINFYNNGKDYESIRYVQLLDQTWNILDMLTFDVYKQSIAFDSLQNLSASKGKMLESIPSIWPIDRNMLTGRIGSFGSRIHPIFRYRHFHSGVDLPGRQGTPIYATAQGKIIESGWRSGYGKNVVIDHGFGYRTRYAHLTQWSVNVGDEVIRGMEIGKMGSTGNSTSSHLHYEVIYRGRHVNPLTFLSKEVRDEDFFNIINSAKETTYDLNN